METVACLVRRSEKISIFGSNHSNYVVKTEFFKKSSRTLILATCYNSIQSHFKIYLDLTMLFNVHILYRKS